MHKMPKSVEKWYKLWINQFPESWHPLDLERFYMFVSILNHRSRIPRDRYWLEKNIREDNTNISDDDIEKYCDLFEHLRDYSRVWKSQQAKQIAVDDAREHLERKPRYTNRMKSTKPSPNAKNRSVTLLCRACSTSNIPQPNL